MPTTKVLVHEYLSDGGALDGVSAHEAAELLAQGRAMRDAMCTDLLAIAGIEVLRCAAPGDWPARVAAADAVWSVAPETGGVLASICASVPHDRWLGCNGAAIAVAGSKSATRRRLRAAGVAVPDEAHDGGAGRCVVKPDDGAGAADMRVFVSFADASAQLRGGMTAERWVDGEPLSASLLCTRRRLELLSVNRQQIEIDRLGGVAFHGVDIAVEPVDGGRGRRLQQTAEQIAAAIGGLRGFVGIDLVWHAARGPVVIEVNPRLTTAYVGLSARLRRNLAGEMLAGWRDG